MGFVRAAQHPVMRDLNDVDFAMWHWPDGLPGHLIARRQLPHAQSRQLPFAGGVLPLRPANQFLAWTPLWEMYLGKGSILVTQLPLIETIQTEPMAAQCSRGCWTTSARTSTGIRNRSLAVLDSVSEPVLNRLKDLRADFRIVDRAGAADPVTLLEMNQPDVKDTDALRKYVQDGGVLVLHRARPEHQAFLANLTGKKVSVEIQPYRCWVDRAMIEKRDGLAEGLSHADFYWRTNIGGEGPAGQWQASGVVEDGQGQVEYVVKVEGVADYLFPGGWVEMTLGKGRIVIDQVKWEVPEKEKNDYGSPMRVASMLLGNLGIVQHLPAPKPSLPQDVRYETLDLASLANRALRDDKGGTTRAGWIGARTRTSATSPPATSTSTAFRSRSPRATRTPSSCESIRTGSRAGGLSRSVSRSPSARRTWRASGSCTPADGPAD